MIFKDEDRIVFAGDSVTDAGSLKPIGEGFFDNLGHGYVRVLESMFAAYYPEIRLRITNSGIEGDTSRTLLERFDRDVVSLNPDWVSICIGINDVWRHFDLPARKTDNLSLDEYEANMEKMITAVKDKVKGIFILSPYYMDSNQNDAMRAKMNDYVSVCEKLSNKYGCIFIDFQKMYDKYFTIRHSSYIAWDRVHPNQRGATLMAREFLKKCGFDYNH